MRSTIAFLAGIALGGGAAVAASLPDSTVTLDWRIPALAVAIAAGILWGARAVRRERERWRLIQEYLAEPEEAA